VENVVTPSNVRRDASYACFLLDINIYAARGGRASASVFAVRNGGVQQGAIGAGNIVGTEERVYAHVRETLTEKKRRKMDK